MFGCSHSYERIVTNLIVVDDTGNSVSSALVYAEAWTYGKTHDFDCALVGENGSIEKEGPILLKCPLKALVTLAAFAPGKRPNIKFRGIVPGKYALDRLVMYDATAGWPHFVGRLAFPFENDKRLRKKLEHHKYKNLVEVFLDVYQPVFESDGEILPLMQQERWPRVKSILKKLQNLYKNTKVN